MKFNDMKYERIDVDEARAFYLALAQTAGEAVNESVLFACMNMHEKKYRQIATMRILAYIRHTQNTSDSFYDEENAFNDANEPLLQEGINAFLKVLCESRFRPELEKEYGSLLFDNFDIELSCFKPEIVGELQKENALSTEYQKLTASAQIDFDGKKLTTSQMGPYMISADREVRKSAYTALGEFYDGISSRLDEIFDELVKVRTQIARKLGFESFTELGYRRMMRNCYTPEDVLTFREQVAEDIVPLVSRLKKAQAARINVSEYDFCIYDDNFTYPQGNPKPIGEAEDILAAGKEMYHRMSPLTGEFIDFMYDNELLDCLSRKGKANGGYCDMIPEYKSPFIFSNFNGTAGDVDVLTHEAGHAFAFYTARDAQLYSTMAPTNEACEVHSMSMEFFAWKYLDLFYGEDGERAKFSHLESSLVFIPYGTMVDHFQHIIYDNPDLTPAQRNEKWLELERIYRPFMNFAALPFYSEGRIWQRQLHIFQHPFYYIDYCLAQTAALEYWALSQENYNIAFEKYLDFVRPGGTKTFTELCEAGGISNPFTQGSLKRIALRAEEYLDRFGE